MRSGKKAIILGGNGFIGKNLATELLAKDYDVTCFDCAAPQMEMDGILYIKGDFFDDNQLEELVRNHDVIYHAVSTINPGNSNMFYMRGYEKDFIQSVHLCEFVQKHHKKLIFLSSGGTVYGKHDVFPIKESAACHPINHYGTVKSCIENAMLAFKSQNDGNMIIARISNPYGPGQDYKKGVGVIDAILKNAIKGTPMTIWGDGEVIRDYIYIKDACAMLVALADYEGKESVFNLSTGEGRSVNEIISLIRNLYPQLSVIYQEGRPVDLPKIILDNSRIQRIYEVPITSIEIGIQLFAKEIEAQEALACINADTVI